MATNSHDKGRNPGHPKHPTRTLKKVQRPEVPISWNESQKAVAWCSTRITTFIFILLSSSSPYPPSLRFQARPHGVITSLSFCWRGARLTRSTWRVSSRACHHISIFVLTWSCQQFCLHSYPVILPPSAQHNCLVKLKYNSTCTMSFQIRTLRIAVLTNKSYFTWSQMLLCTKAHD